MTGDRTPENGRNEAFSRLLAVVRRLEWTGLTADGEVRCPACGAPGPGGPHITACDLKSALEAATGTENWPWCRCDACECPNQVDPSLTGALCRDCLRDRHHDEITSREA